MGLKEITLEWADAPKGSYMNQGILILRAESADKIVAIQKIGLFTGLLTSRKLYNWL